MDLRFGFTAVKWLTNVGRRAVTYRRPHGGEGISPMSNTLTVKTDVGDIEVRESELASITDEKLEQMGMSLADLRFGFTAVKWLTNVGRRAVAYRRPDGGLMVQGVKLD